MLSHFVDQILNLPPQVLSHWGYLILLVASVVESLPLIGLAVPGGVIVIAAGFFARVGILHVVPTIIIAIVGAFIGDTISYLLGRKYGYSFLTKLGRLVFIKPVHFEKTKEVLHKHPRKALIVGRFHALTRCIVPFAAGSTDISPLTFFPITIISCITWAIFNVAIGLIFGQSFAVASHYVGIIFFIALAVSILIIYSYRFISKFTAKNKQLIDRYQLYPVAINLIAVYSLAKITESVIMYGRRIHSLDIHINAWFQTARTPWVTSVFIFITSLATPTNLIIISVLFALYFAIRHRWYFLTLLPSALIAGLISQEIMKRAFHIMRPLQPLVITADFSFPSGHATLATIFFGLLAYFFKDSFKGPWHKARKWIHITSCLALVLIVCISRLYLNAHWFSDVLAGIALGVFWITFFIILFHFFRSLSGDRVAHEFETELVESTLE